ncbi:MAG: hypothetical protein FWE15_06890 [Actinomycetia bacterium]|nr:hypothetical protein [Actinomycetes bacterium]
MDDVPDPKIINDSDATVRITTSAIQSFPLGQAMNENLTLKLGNCNHRRYVPGLKLRDEAATGRGL